MSYGTGNCPNCGVKFNVRESSIGTVRRCEACGAKFIVQERLVPSAAPARGCGTCAMGLLLLGVVAIGGVGALACAGFAFVGGAAQNAQANRHVKDRPVIAAELPNTKPSEEKEPLREVAPFNLETLCGLSIDQIKIELGNPEGTEREPTALNQSAGIEVWENLFERDGFELLVTFNARTREVEDFFISGDNEDDLFETWDLKRDSVAYRVEAVPAISGSGITGVKVIPTAQPTDVIAPKDKHLSNTRTWHDRSGKFSTEARFGGMTSGVVTLHKSDGTTVKIRIDELSESDHKWIESRR